jgi:hypothetical protein
MSKQQLCCWCCDRHEAIENQCSSGSITPLTVSLVWVFCCAAAAATNPAKTCDAPDTLTAAPAALYVHVPQEQEAPGAPAHQPRLLCAASNSTRVDGQQWSCNNWAGTISWAPSAVVVPASEDDLAAFLQASALASAATGAPRPPLKVVGFAHSWAGLYTPAKSSDGSAGITLALHKLSGSYKSNRYAR